MKKFSFAKPNTKYYLGLDLGIASVGWAVMVETNTNAPFLSRDYLLHDFGVHLFDMAGDAKKGISDAEQRRLFRSRRRLIRRRKQRIEALQKILENCGLDWKNLHSSEKVKQTNKILIENGRFTVEKGKENIYLLKVKALKEKVTFLEFYKILINFAKKRGYLDKFTDDEKGKDNKRETEHKSAIDKAENITKNQSISETILNEKAFRIPETETKNSFILYVKNGKFNIDPTTNTDKNFRFLFSRKAYQKELEQIITKQFELRKDNAIWKKINENKGKIVKRIFKQRDFEVGPKCQHCQKGISVCPKFKICSKYKTYLDLVGNCPYYPDQKRGGKATLLFTAWYFAQEISKIFANFSKISYSKEFYLDLLKKCLTGQMDKTKLKKIFKEHPEYQNFKLLFDNYFQSNAWNDKNNGISINKDYYLKEIRKIPALRVLIEKINFQEDLIEQLSDIHNPINLIGKVLTENITPQRRLDKLNAKLKEQKINLTENEIEILKETESKAHTHCKVSYKLMKEQLQTFLSGNFKLSDKSMFGKFDFEKNNQIKKNQKIFQQWKDRDMETNPIVFRAVNEARKVLKALHNAYGDFQNISIEIGRDVSQSFKERKRTTKIQTENEKENKRIEDELLAANIRVNDKNITKYKLWKQQNECCLYSGEKISLIDFSKSGILEIDHIVPQSIWGDDSINNKVLVYQEENQKKGDKLPKQYLDNQAKKNYEARVNDMKNNIKSKKIHPFYRISWKKWNYLNLENTEGKIFQEFISKSLNDIRYISKWFSTYVKQQLKLFDKDKTNVNLVPGQITSFLRRRWIPKSAWGLSEKVREITPFHHAVDAMVLVQLTGQWYVELAIDLNNLFRKYQVVKKEKEKGQQRWQCEIALEEYNNLKNRLLNKWTKKELKSKKYQEILHKFIKNNFEQQGLFIQDLTEQIEQRIPVKIEKEKVENEDKKIWVPKYKNVLNQEEWEKQTQNLQNQKNINLRFPIISYKQNYRLRGAFSLLENFGFKEKDKTVVYRLWKKRAEEKTMISTIAEIKIRKQLKKIKEEKNYEKKQKLIDEIQNQYQSWNDKLQDQVEKNNFLPKQMIQKLIEEEIVKSNEDFVKKIAKWKKEFENKKGFIENKYGNIITTNAYYGFLINYETKKSKWIERLEVQNWFKKKLTKEKSKIIEVFKRKKDLVVKGVNIQYFDEKLKKTLVKTFQNKMGDSIRIQPNSLICIGEDKKNKRVFGKTNYYDSISNIFKDKNYKVIKNDILGNILN